MKRVEIETSNTTLIFADESTGLEEKRLLSIASISYAVNRTEKSIENSNAIIRLADVDQKLLARFLPELPTIKGREVKIYDDETLLFVGSVSEFRPATDSIEIKADIYTGGLDSRIFGPITKTEFPECGDNQGKYSNIVFGVADGESGILTAYRVESNKYLAALHPISKITGVFDRNGQEITSSCQLINEPDGRAYILYEADETEIYYNCQGFYPAENLIQNGDFENWQSSVLPSNWVVYSLGQSAIGKSQNAHTGSFCVFLEIDGENNVALVRQDFNIEIETTFTLSFFYKHSSTGKTAIWGIRDSADTISLVGDAWVSGVVYNQLTNTTEWAYVETSFLAQPGAYKLILARSYAPGSYIYFDDVLIEARDITTNPADMLAALIEGWGEERIKIEPESLAKACIIFASRNYHDSAVLVLDREWKWRQLISAFCTNFDALPAMTANGGISISVLDWGDETSNLSISPIFVNWETFCFFPDIDITGRICRMYAYHFRKNYFSYLPEDVEVDTDSNAAKAKKLDLRFHRADMPSRDVAGRFLAFASTCQFCYKFQLHEVEGRGIAISRLYNLEMKSGPFIDQTRLVQIIRKALSGNCYEIEALDVSLINENVIRLYEDERKIVLSEPHSLL